MQLFPGQKPGEHANPHKWIGRVAIFELITGSRLQGKIIGMSNEWIDTDNGAIRVAHIVSAKWVTPEEETIIRGGPLGYWDGPKQIR